MNVLKYYLAGCLLLFSQLALCDGYGRNPVSNNYNQFMNELNGSSRRSEDFKRRTETEKQNRTARIKREHQRNKERARLVTERNRVEQRRRGRQGRIGERSDGMVCVSYNKRHGHCHAAPSSNKYDSNNKIYGCKRGNKLTLINSCKETHLH